ncbi:MAG: hypothetical protein NTV81_01125 [Candidatus Komeilibacteria bacterium]|nr:hypothetical protein [Candidatus Komeilibacteria bacterium]
MDKHWAIILIKPDAVRDVLEEMILNDLREGTFIEIIFRKYWFVTRATACLLYADWVDKPQFPAMVHNLTSGQSLLVIAQGDADIYASLRQVKGKMNQGGLRLKYRTRSIEEWESLGYSGSELQNRIAENRLHTTDDFQDTIQVCSLALENHEIDALNLIAPRLSSSIRQRRALQIRTAC